MSYYQCPKCGGRDTYHGTELVSGSKGGGAIIGPENDLGFSPVVGVGGRTTTSEQTVVKCKTCDINLGQKDIRYSKEELEKIEAKSRFSESISTVCYFIITGGLLIMITVISAAFVLPSKWSKVLEQDGIVFHIWFEIAFGLAISLNFLMWWAIIRRRKKSQR